MQNVFTSGCAVFSERNQFLQLYDQDMVIKFLKQGENLRNWVLNWERQSLTLNFT